MAIFELSRLEQRVLLSGVAGAVPQGPSLVSVLPGDRRVFVRQRLGNGALADAAPLVMHGVDWSPVSVGSTGPSQAEFVKWYATDIPLMEQMGVNVVRVYHDFGTGAQATAILDAFYEHGIQVIMTVDSPVHGVVADTANIAPVVNAYKDHPAILMWAVGNEWDLNNLGNGFYYGTFGTLPDAAQFVEQSAQLIKSLDANHPVTTFMADPHIPNVHPLSLQAFPYLTGLTYTSDIVNTLAPDVDVWGFNVYRGASFGDVFGMWQSISDKPMFIGEFGADAYDHGTGAVNEALQASFDGGLWDELYFDLSAERSDGVALGGLVFEWRDEWWKNGSPSTHNISSEPNGGQPDGFNDEEYFGLADINQVTRQAFDAMQARFTQGQPAVVLDAAPALEALSQPADLNFNGLRFSVDGKTVYQRTGGADGGRGISVGVLDTHTGIRMLKTRTFDTWLSPSGWGGPHTNFGVLVDYLDGLPDGSVILLAIGDEGGFINPGTGTAWNDAYVQAGYAALEALGSTQVRQVGYQGGWSMIAVKGEGALAEAHSDAGQGASVQGQPSLALDADFGRRAAGQTVNVEGTEGVDTIEISAAGAVLSVSVNGVEETYALGDVAHVVVNTLAGADTVNLLTALPVSPSVITGGVGDTLAISGGSYSFLDGTSDAYGLNVTATDARVVFVGRTDLGTLALAGATVAGFGAAGDDILHTSQLSIQAGASLDLWDHGMVLDYEGTPPIDALRMYVRNGQVGQWPAIVSSAPDNPESPTTFALVDNLSLMLDAWNGATIADGVNFRQLIVDYTFRGDTNVDGRVTDADYTNVIANMSSPGTWQTGDLNLDGVVSVDDMAEVMLNLGAGSGGAAGPALVMAGAVAMQAMPPAALMAIFDAGPAAHSEHASATPSAPPAGVSVVMTPQRRRGLFSDVPIGAQREDALPELLRDGGTVLE